MENSPIQPRHGDPPRGLGLRSLSGHRLKGRSLVKIAYLDEAGKSKPDQEPYLVVAAVILDGDKDTGRLVKEFEALAKQYKLRGISNFHAKDIWHGNEAFDRDDPKWPLARRMELLGSLAAIPKKLNLPVAIGHVHRAMFTAAHDEYYKSLERRFSRNFKRTKSQLYASQHAAAFVKAAKCIDTWMRKHAPNERAMLISENVSDIKRDLKLLHLVAQDRTSDIEIVGVKTFKTEHIIDTLYFAEKRECPFLQMADICAFICKRKLMKAANIDGQYKLLEPQIIRLNRTDEPFSLDFYYYDEGDE